MYLFTYRPVCPIVSGKCRVNLSLYLAKKLVKKVYCERMYRSTAPEYPALGTLWV